MTTELLSLCFVIPEGPFAGEIITDPRTNCIGLFVNNI